MSLVGISDGNDVADFDGALARCAMYLRTFFKEMNLIVR